MYYMKNRNLFTLAAFIVWLLVIIYCIVHLLTAIYWQ